MLDKLRTCRLVGVERKKFDIPSFLPLSNLPNNLPQHEIFQDCKGNVCKTENYSLFSHKIRYCLELWFRAASRN